MKNRTQPKHTDYIARYGNMGRYHAIVAILPKTYAYTYAAHLRGERIPARKLADARRAIVAHVAGDYEQRYTVFSDGSAIRSYINHAGIRAYSACLSCLDAGCYDRPGIPADVIRKGMEIEAALPSCGVYNLTPLAQRLLAKMEGAA